MSSVYASISAHIIDDDYPISDLLAQMLRNFGFNRIVKSHSIREATELHGDSVCDVFFIDIELSDGNGLDLIAQVNERYPLAKVIVFSGHTTPQNVKRASTLEINGFLVKPFSLNSLARVLHHSDLVAAVA